MARASPAYSDRERSRLSVLSRHLLAALCRAYAGSAGYTAHRLVPRVEPVVLGCRDQVLQPHDQRAGPSGRPHLFTAREDEVMSLVARGWTNAQVARRLGIAPATVAKHLEHVYAKLGVDNRVSALHAINTSSSAGGRGA